MNTSAGRIVLSRIATTLRSRAFDLVDRFTGAGAWHGQKVPRKLADATGIAFVGCGFVADFYAFNLRMHPELRLVGMFDRDRARLLTLQGAHGGRAYRNLEELLSDPAVEIVVNLTDPASHHGVSKAALLAGKHVYSEKPLALSTQQAADLVETSERLGLLLSSAPCIHLGNSLQGLGAAVRDGLIGRPRLVYAELDDGPIHLMQPGDWASPSGIPWPWRNEFQMGCTIEHAAYHVSWMVMLFGPVAAVSATAARLVADKHPDLAEHEVGPDLSVAVLRFESGVIARLTCSIVASHDHSLRIVGDKGELSLDEIWHGDAPVRLRRFTDMGLRAASYHWVGRHGLAAKLLGSGGRRVGPGGSRRLRSRLRRHQIDYALGIKELARAIKNKGCLSVPPRLALHINEVVLAIAGAGESGSVVELAPGGSDRP